MTQEQGWNEANEHQDFDAGLDALYAQVEHLRRDIGAYIDGSLVPSIESVLHDLGRLIELDVVGDYTVAASSARQFLQDAARMVHAARALTTQGLTP